MSALDDLHRFYDGPIAHHLRRAAIAEDFAASLRAPRPPVKARVKTWKPAGIIDRMADVMRFAARQRNGLCYRQDLAEAGFSTAEIDAHHENARALAARRAAETAEQQQVEIPVAAILIAARQMREGTA